MFNKTLSLTNTQQGIWLADQVSENKQLYTIAHCLEMAGKIQSDYLEKSIRQALSEADTVIADYHDGKQTLSTPNTVDNIIIEKIDLAHLQNGRAEAMSIMQLDTHQDLTLNDTQQQPLTKQILFCIHENDQDVWLWYQRYHHIMLDGFSFTALTKRVAELYTSRCKNEALPSSPFTPVAQVIEEEATYLASDRYTKDKAFWCEYCSALPTAASLSYKQTKEPFTDDALLKHIVPISQNQLNALRELGDASKSNSAELLMSLLTAYLYRVTGQSHQVIGVPFMRRLGSVSISSVAPMVNVLPMSIQLESDFSWSQLALQFKKSLKVIRRHQNYSAEKIQRDLNRVGAEDFYQSLINYKQFDYELDFFGVAGITHHLATGPVDDFEFSIIVEAERTLFEFRANGNRYDIADLERHGRRISSMLTDWLSTPTKAVSHVSIMDEEEQLVINKWSQGHQFEPNSASNILDIFWQQVEEKPNATALVCRNPQQQAETGFTFLELGQAINRLSHYLLNHPNLSIGDKKTVIASAMPRSADSIISMMSILNIGATYLPLDLDYPAERMQMMCEDTQPALILSHFDVSLELEIERVNLDEQTFIKTLSSYSNTLITADDRPTPSGDDIAYVIFTSGSTGRPKGVMNTHSAMLNLLLSHQESIYRPAQKVIQERYPGRALRAAHTHSFSFDSSWLQIFWLIQGEELYVFDEETRRDAYAIVQEVREIHIDAMDLPPSLLAQLLNNGLMTSHAEHSNHQPSLILIGGEACPAALWQQLRSYPSLVSHNLYGPTEYTVDTLRANLSQHEQPTIGRPISNTQTYILDTQLQPLPIGVLGELYISGAGLAHGYLAQAELTSSRFVADPFCQKAGVRMYRTGDIVRWSADGFVEFIGRGDDQVKIRGHRVEIGEVENALSMLDSVESAVVIAEAINNSHRLLGYCVVPNVSADEQHTYAQQLLNQLRQNLPEYMIPAGICVMDTFPRNVSGKVDKKALPKIALQQSSNQVATENEQEEQLCHYFEAILKVESVGAVDDFFALGGDSISAMMLCTELRKSGYQLRPSQVFKLRTVRELAKGLEAISNTANTKHQWALPTAEWDLLTEHYDSIAEVTPLLPLQKGMLFETLMNSASGNYNAYTRLNFSGELDTERLQLALDALLTRYPQLAGAFDSELLSEPIMVIPETHKKRWQWPLNEYNLSKLSATEKYLALSEIEQKSLKEPQSTNQFIGMIKAVYVNLGVDETTKQCQSSLILIVHHLVIDGWSTPLLLSSLFDAYQQEILSLQPTKQSYANVIKTLHAQDKTESFETWRNIMHQAEPCILFEQRHDAVNELEFSLDQDTSEQLTKHLKTNGTTLNVFMQLVWAHSLNCLSGKEDIIFGSPVSGRNSQVTGVEEQVGLFLNTIPIRVSLQPTASFWDQLPKLQDRHIELLEHDSIGLAEIQNLIGNQSLFDTLLVVENYPDNEYLDVDLSSKQDQPLKVTDIHNRGYSHYPLALLVLPGEKITLLLENRGALSSVQLSALADRLEQTITICLEHPERPLCRYPSLSEQEKLRIEAINATDYLVPELTLQSALRKQAKQTPNALCLSDMQHQLNYSQARYQVECLTQELRLQGVSSGDIVAVALPRSCQLSIAIWAIIDVGAAYLPLDVSYPNDRLAYMLEDAKPVLLISEHSQSARFDSINNTTRRLSFDALFNENRALKPSNTQNDQDITGEHAAYLIYTSGTTGRPKGVLVSHKAIINRILWMQNEYQLTTTDVVLQKTPCSFDVSVWEFFWAPMIGASLVMAEPEAHRDPDLLMQTIHQFGVTTLHFVPSMLAIFTASMQEIASEQARCSSLKQVFCSGEALLKAQASAFKETFNAQLHNLYGPTEAAVDVTYKPAYDDLTSNGQGVAIGKPVWNTQLRILDQYLRQVPVGGTGELYLAGVQLAIGYLDRPELNGTRFVADPFGESGERMYRTGDIVRWLENGDVEYLGRADNQIKIRGQRIELGEIETQLLLLDNIEQAVVVARTLNEKEENSTGQDNRQLVAYLILKPDSMYDETLVKAALSEELPSHMLPVAYILLDDLPLSANGKLDRNALPEPKLTENITTNKTARAPAIGIETQLANLFSTLLGIEGISAEDDFFALGGHSLLAMRLAADIRREIKQPITVGQIMVTPTVEKLANLLSTNTLEHGREKLAAMLNNNDYANTGFDDLIYLREGKNEPLFCFYPGSGFAWQYSALSRYITDQRPIIGLQSPRPNGLIANSQNMEELINNQLAVIQRVQPKGPYYLLGYSLGGTVAYGVAAKLRNLGEEVNFLGLLDTYPAEVHDWNDPEGEEAIMGAEREQAQHLSNAIAANEAKDIDLSVKQEQDKMLEQIFENYRDAVRLLKQASTPDYDSKMHVFIAQQSLPNYIQPKEHWKPFANNVSFHYLDYCSHEDILGPENLKILGPLLDNLIEESDQITTTEGI
jgi:amino acid adenylation domain-containing protein